MRKLIVWNLMTLDGYFEGPKPWDLDFHMLAWGPELERYGINFGQEGDLLIFGRNTYEGMAAYWPHATSELEIKKYMNKIAKIVISKKLKKAEWHNTRIVRDPVAELAKLRNEPGKDMYIFGSGELIASLQDHDLIDEYRICVVPVLLGGGRPLFKTTGKQLKLKLIDAHSLQTGGVILRYEPVREAAASATGD